jgi:hypothetical protein
MPVRRGREPKKAHSARKILAATKKPGKNTKSENPVDVQPTGDATIFDGKNPQNHCIPPFGHRSGPARSTGVADPRHFPEKTGLLFPDQEPPLFFGFNAHPGTPEVSHDQLILPHFHGQKNAAKLAGFFPIKSAHFQKYRFL